MDLNRRQRELLQAATVRRRFGGVLTVQELGDLLSVSVRTIRRMHAQDRGPPRIRRSRRQVYPIADLASWFPVYLSEIAGNEEATPQL